MATDAGCKSVPCPTCRGAGEVIFPILLSPMHVIDESDVFDVQPLEVGGVERPCPCCSPAEANDREFVRCLIPSPPSG